MNIGEFQVIFNLTNLITGKFFRPFLAYNVIVIYSNISIWRLVHNFENAIRISKEIDVIKTRYLIDYIHFISFTETHTES